MITIIHGDDIVSSRKEFTSLKQITPQSISLDGDKLGLAELMQAMSGGGLFEETQKIFIEQLLSRKKSNELEQLLGFLAEHKDQAEIYIWENKEVDKKILTTLKSPLQKLHKIPQTLFQFMDSLRPGNAKYSISLFHQTLEASETELVFFMLIRQFRILLALSDERPNAQIDEVKRMADWQKSKLRKQAHTLGQARLIEIYRGLYELDMAQKTGNLTLPLRASIDILLMDI